MKDLIRLINLPRNTIEITITRDGYYLGRAEDDIGFNQFFGKPSHHKGIGRDTSIQTWKNFSFSQRKNVIRVAKRVRVKLRNFLPKGDLK